MGRPTGVTILAILCFIGAGLCLLGGLAFLLGGGALATMMNQQGGNAGAAGMLAGLGAFAGVCIIIVGGIYALVGFGLWKLKEWARIVTIILTAIGAVLNLPGLLATLTHFNLGALIWTLFWLAIDVWIIMYLLKPHVKAAFQGAARAASA
jgi:hypothetical protein